MSWSYTYTERLNGEVIDVTLPDTRKQAWEWYREIELLAKTDPVRWKAQVRAAMASDLYLCGLFHTWWQRLDAWTGRPEVDCDFQFDFARWKQFEGDDALDYAAREHGKAVAVDEPVPTPSGWVNHGDLRPGDAVFGPDGLRCRVVGRTPVYLGCQCYRVSFDDGYSVVVSGDHLWSVELRGSHARLPAIRSTEELSKMDMVADRRPSIPVAQEIVLPGIRLAIDPYLLGAWLGDGHTNQGTITCGDKEVFQRIEQLGWTVGKRRPSNRLTRTIHGLSRELRLQGLLGDKRIPAEYKWASAAQRWDLLRGLMDTDGYVNPRGTAYLGLKLERLARDAYELAMGLGLKPCLRVTEKSHGKVYTVTFQAYRDPCPVSLPRKIERCREGQGNGRARRRFFISVEAVESVPVSCIQVDRADGLYLIGRHFVTTHNSTWTFVRLTQEVCRDPNVCAGVFSADLKLALRPVIRWGGRDGEIVKNALIKTCWDDVFYWDPHDEGAFWSNAAGYIVKRTISSSSPTLSAHTFTAGLPDGSRFGIIIFDDVEVDKLVESDEQRAKIKERFHNALQLGGRGCRKWINGTFHHHSGLLADLIKKGWRANCFPAEDVTQDPPDVNDLYDACGGVRPDNGAKIPEAVRQVKLRGKANYLHPMECAIKRWEQGNEIYERQSMGDASAGQVMRFLPEWVAEEMRIKADLHEFARDKFGYLVIDPSKGRHDPSVALMLAADSDKTLTIVDALRRKVTPSQLEQQIYGMVIDWHRVLDIRQIRVEVFGQATWDHNIRRFFESRNFNGPPVYGLGTHMGSKPDQGIFRAWLRLEPLFRAGRIRLPHRLDILDEQGRFYDFVDYFLEFEYNSFPNPNTDDILAALSLIGEPDTKVPPIEYPDRVVPWGSDDWDVPRVPPAPGIDEESFLWN